MFACPCLPACLTQPLPNPELPSFFCHTSSLLPAAACCPPAWPPACPAPPLQATFKNQNDLGFQDSVGRLLLESAHTIPDGLLVFMPSYAMLDRLTARWKVWVRVGCGF